MFHGRFSFPTLVKACVKYCNIYIYIYILITTDNITILYTCTYNIHVVYIYIYIFMYVYTIINHKNICTVYACKWPHAVGPPCVGCNVARAAENFLSDMGKAEIPVVTCPLKTLKHICV